MLVENPDNGTTAYSEFIVRNAGATNDIRIGSSANYTDAQWQGGWVFATQDLLLKSNNNVEIFAGGTADSNIVATFTGSEAIFTGNVGINQTTAPNAAVPLEITSPSGSDSVYQQWTYSSSPTAYRLQLSQVVTTGVVRYSFSQRNNNTDYDNVLVLDRGNVGINNQNPLAKLDIHMSDSNGTYGRGKDGNLNLENTNTANTEGGWLSISGYMGNTVSQYQMGAISGGKVSAAGNDNYGGYLSLWTTSGGLNGEANSGQYERVRIDDAGNVGIGTTSINFKQTNRKILELNGNSEALFAMSNGGSWQYYIHALASGIYHATGNKNLLLEVGTAKVGIGTTSPSEKLEVNGKISAGDGVAGAVALTDDYNGSNHIGNIGWNRSSGGVYLAYGVKQEGSADWKSTFANFAGERSYLKLDEDSLSLAWAGAQTVAVGTAITMTERFRFDLQNQRFGIGTDSPQAPVHIIAPSSADNQIFQRWSYQAGTPTQYSLTLKDTVTSGVVRYNFSMTNNNTVYDDVLVLDRGKVGINTTNPNYRLHVNSGTTQITDYLLLGEEAYSSSSAYVGLKTTLMSGANDYMILSGKTDGGTYVSAKDGSTLYLRGGGNNSNNEIRVLDGSTIDCTTSQFRVSGDIVAYYSDMRLKTKIGDIENPIGKIQALSGFYYEPNEVAESYGYEKERRIGLSAQDVKEVIPEAITDAAIGDGYMSVDYAKLVPVLVEAIKEQQKQIDELKAKLDA